MGRRPAAFAGTTFIGLALLLSVSSQAADGLPDLTTADGGHYYGSLRDGKPNGRGRVEWDNGAVYKGEFANGLFDGRGRFESPRGEIFEGEFVDGVFKPLIAQRQLLGRALAGIARGRPGTIELYLLAVGGDGTQEVFRREVEFVRQEFDQRFGTQARSVALANGKGASLPMASVATIGEALGTLAERMNRDEDILFVFLTSRGTPTHELRLLQPGFALRDLPAAELGRMLRRSGIRWKVVVVSACYSGGFIDSLRDDNTLVITASRYDRSSFGCADDAELTYFGRAFFKEALPSSRTFQEAFTKADALVAEWERKDLPKEPRSLPQLRSAAPIERQLQRWAAQGK